MKNSHARVLLIAAYAVILLEMAIPIIDHPIGNRFWQSAGLSFATLNIAVLALLRSRLLALTCIVLDGVLAVVTLIGGLVLLWKYWLPPLSSLDYLAVIGFFAGVVPIVSAHFLYTSVARLTIGPSDRGAAPSVSQGEGR
jgi:hypothetical protein